MERLTINYPDGAVQTIGKIDEIVLRLAAYEDTGLEPEEAKAKCAWADKACKLLDGVFGGSGVFDFTHIKELLTAEAEGRLVVLPCKVGDTVYAIKNQEIYATAVIGFRVHEWTGLWVLLLFDERKTNGSYELRIDDFGKTAFLTREEAEVALRGGAENGENLH